MPAKNQTPTAPALPPTPSASPEVAVDLPTAEEIQQQLAALEQAPLDEAQRTEISQFLQKAMESLGKAEQAKQKIAQFKAEIEAAPATIEAARQRSSQSLGKPQADAPSDAPVDQLEKIIGDLEAQLAEARKTYEKAVAAADSKLRSERKNEFAARVEAALAKQQQIIDELKAGPLPDELPLRAESRLMSLAVRRETIRHQIASLEAERRREDALAELFPLERDFAQRYAGWLERTVGLWHELLAQRRKAELQQQVIEARNKVQSAIPELRSFAEKNAQFAEQRTSLTGLLEKAAKELQQTSEVLDALKQDFQRVTEKVEVGGMTAASGLLLRNRRDHLPSPAQYRQSIKACNSEMQRVQLVLLELEEERAGFGDVQRQLWQLTSHVADQAGGLSRDEIGAMIRELAEGRRQYLDDLLHDYKTYHDDLSDLELSCRKLLEQLDVYAKFVDERVLWIQSEQPLHPADAGRSWGGMLALASPEEWAGVLQGIMNEIWRRPTISGLIACGAIALVVLRRRIRLKLEQIGQGTRLEVSLLPTVQAVLLTVLLASVAPMLIYFVGWLLAEAPGTFGLTVDLARGLKSTAMLFWAIEILRQVCRPHGLGERHFKWNGDTIAMLHRSLVSLMVLGLPSVFVVTVLETYADGQWRSSLGRMALIAGLLLLALGLKRVLRPSDGLIAQLLRNYRSTWTNHLPHVVYFAALTVCLATAVLVVLGYSYSAHQLLFRLNETLWLVLGLILLHALLLRGCDIVRRTILMRRWRLHSEPQPGDSDPQRANSHAEVAHKTSVQLQQLLRGVFTLTLLVGSAMIWADMFPALGILDSIELWSTTAMVTAQTMGENEELITTTAEQRVPVTLADLLVSMLILVAMVLAARSMPGLLEITVLGRLPIDSGGRHAIALISRYAVTVVGIVLACRSIGIQWASVQWLAAAMTVGLGFGLQEIFANLVSGIIILLERPIRVGDIVTVNGATGTVTRMQIRATTLTDADNRELIVPNKKFITDDVINWTLTDSITRFVIPVGISYESDSSKAREILLRLAEENPLVLKEPPPAALIVGFGDSTKNLELRAYLLERKSYIDVTNELYIAIERAFQEAGIEIAFPQQEIRIKSVHLGDMASERLPVSVQVDSPAKEQRAA
jgi:potassium efflux system protein